MLAGPSAVRYRGRPGLDPVHAAAPGRVAPRAGVVICSAGASRSWSARPSPSAISIGRRCRSRSRRSSETSRSRNEQFSLLQSSFLIAYAVMYAGGGKLMDVLGTRRRLPRHHAVLVAGVRQPRSGDQLRDARRQPAAARHGRGRRLSGGDARGRRMVSRARALDGDGHHQRRDRGRRRGGAAADRAGDHGRGLARRVLPHRPVSAWPGRCGGGSGHYSPEQHPRLAGDRARAAAPSDRGRPHGGSAAAMADAAAGAADLGARHGEVPERRGLVFLSVLAAEIPL